jgi:hypothetical protein
LESQRVRLLTEGYLRGWLTFDYQQAASIVREEIILSHLMDERYYELLKNKLFVEATLRASLAPTGNKDIFDPVYEANKQLIGLKLPLALPADTIENKPKGNPANDKFLKKNLTEEDLAEYKKILEDINKDRKHKKAK